MTSLLSWIIRYGHVLGAATWVGGYALLAFLIVPMLGKGASETLVRLAIVAVRFLTYAGTLTIAFGVILITRTNCFGQLLGSAWGRSSLSVSSLPLLCSASAMVRSGLPS